MKTIQPSSSYFLTLPDDIREEHDGRVSSFWLDGLPLLLQLSSYLRVEENQVGAGERLTKRMAKDSEHWPLWEKKICPELPADQATAELLDDNDVFWLHTYLVWPHIAIYATISGPADEVSNPNSWARRALKSIELVIQ